MLDKTADSAVFQRSNSPASSSKSGIGRVALAAIFSAALAGCSGGSSTPAEAWAGSVVTSEGSPILTSEKANGTFHRSSGLLTVQTDKLNFVSAGPADSNGKFTAANGDTAERIDRGLIANDYDNALPLVLTVNNGGTNVVSQGVFGLPTTAAVMGEASNNVGTATFNGEAAITSQNTISGAVRHRSANTQVNVDFSGSGAVDIIFANITVPANNVSPTIDAMQVTGATITDSGFSGGTVTAALGGSNALPAITNGGEVTTVNGNFFGADANGTLPDEVGGVVLIEGDDGSVNAIFIAD